MDKKMAFLVRQVAQILPALSLNHGNMSRAVSSSASSLHSPGDCYAVSHLSCKGGVTRGIAKCKIAARSG